MAKLQQAFEQLKAADAHLSVNSYVSDGEKFAALVALCGVKVSTDWVSSSLKGQEPQILEYFETVIDGVRIRVSHFRAPTVKDWTAAAERAS